MQMGVRPRKHIFSLCKKLPWPFCSMEISIFWVASSEFLLVLELSLEATLPLAGDYRCHSYRSEYQQLEAIAYIVGSLPTRGDDFASDGHSKKVQGVGVVT